MINLLPLENRRQLQAARSNTLLLRYNVLLFGMLIFLALAIGVVYFYLSAARDNAQATIAQNAAKVSSYAPVEAQAQQFRSNLAIARQILDNEVTYSKVILAIANILPAGVTLQNLNLNAQTFGTPTVLIGQAANYNDALAFKSAFEKSPLFTDVYFQSISDNGTANGGGYPISVSLAVTIQKDAAK